MLALQPHGDVLAPNQQQQDGLEFAVKGPERKEVELPRQQAEGLNFSIPAPHDSTELHQFPQHSQHTTYDMCMGEHTWELKLSHNKKTWEGNLKFET